MNKKKTITDIAKHKNAEVTGIVISHWMSIRYTMCVLKKSRSLISDESSAGLYKHNMRLSMKDFRVDMKNHDFIKEF